VATEIRPASAADGPAIARVRRESWFAAYAGIIDAQLIDRATAPGGHGSSAAPSYRTTLVAVAPEEQAVGGTAGAQPQAVIGYTAFGPERTVASAIPPNLSLSGGADEAAAPRPEAAGPPPGPLTEAGLAGETGELYALYLTPAWWSAGIGRALTDAVLTALRADSYRRVVLWTLTGNARARRFYETAGFAPDGATNILTGLGGVEELRYVRDL